MKRIGVVSVVVVVATIATLAHSREAVTLSIVQEKAKIDAATPENQAYLDQFFANPWRLALNAADEQCRAAQIRSDTSGAEAHG